SATVGGGERIAGDHAHLRNGDTDSLRHDLAHDGLGPVALVGAARGCHDGAVGVNAHATAVLRGDARTADAIHERAWVGQLDEARQTDAAVDTLPAQSLLLIAQRRVVHHAEQLGEGCLVAEALKLHAGGRGTRIAAVFHQIAAAGFDGIEAEGLRGEVHEALGDSRGDRVADGSVLAGRRLVLEDDGGFGADVGEVVGSADQVHNLIALHRAGAGVDGGGTDARQVVDVDGGDPPGGIYRHARSDAMVRGVMVAREVLEPVGDELDRPAHDFGNYGNSDFVGIDVHLDAIAAADVAADDAHVALG